jgi:hypothetical protein
MQLKIVDFERVIYSVIIESFWRMYYCIFEEVYLNKQIL